MRVTKYEHACLVCEEQGKRLVVDPGSFTKSLTDYQNIVGVIITHVHGDHFDKELVTRIAQANPDVIIVSVKEVTDELSGLNTKTVNAGSAETVGPFSLAFYGGHHAFIHDGKPVNQNVGVLINETLYYPGDSFSLPEKMNIKAAAVPSSGPWMKAGEAMDFILALKPQIAFPTHDAFLSEVGEQYMNNWLAQAEGVGYKPLGVGESLEIG